MKKILLILSLFPILVFSQKSYKIPADSTILNNIGSGKNELVIRNATSNITGGVLTNLGNGVTAFVLGGGSARVVDTIYKNNTKDSIVFTISGIRYAVKDSFNLNTDSQTLSISNDTLTISGGNSVILPVYIQIDSSTINSYDVLNSQNTPPISPNTGDVYLVGTVPTGAWVGQAKDIAEWNGSGWVFTDGVQGDFLYNATTALTYIFRSGNWVQTTGIPALNNGNTISSGLKIGTNNARSLKFETANLERGRIDSLGRYYIYDTSLRYSNKYVQVDSLTGRLIATEIPYNDGVTQQALNDSIARLDSTINAIPSPLLTLTDDSLNISGGNTIELPYIPLSGTKPLKPVTGNIKVNNGFSLYSNGVDSGSYSAYILDDIVATINAFDNYSGNGSSFVVGSNYAFISSTNPSSLGIKGNENYSANAKTDGLAFAQYEGVRSEIADTATQIRSEIADTASSLHTLIDAKVNTTILSDSLAKKTNKLISFSSYTTSDTLRLTDSDKVIEMNVGSANNLVIPTNTAYAFPVGTQIVLIQIGAGQTTFVPASGVTVHSSGSKLKLTGQYSGATIIKKATNEWYLFGDITN